MYIYMDKENGTGRVQQSLYKKLYTLNSFSISLIYLSTYLGAVEQENTMLLMLVFILNLSSQQPGCPMLTPFHFCFRCMKRLPIS